SVSSLTTDYLISSYLICYVHNMASTNFFTLSLHDALPISPLGGIVRRRRRRRARVTASTDTAPPTAPQAPLRRTLGIATVAVGACLLIVLLCALHLAQGTADVGALDVLRVLLGQGDDLRGAVVSDSRMPPLLAGVLVGLALGAAGALLQSIARNALASPDTMGVNAGAHLALTAVAALG